MGASAAHVVAAASFDADRAEAFGRRLAEVLNGGALALMLSIGHRTGLFDVLRDRPPSTSDEVARAAGLDERYVREWLAAMVTGAIVDYDPESRRYRLPPEHAASLGRGARPWNFASTAQWIALLGGVEDAMVERFSHGGGLDYAAYGRFHAVMTEESDRAVVARLADEVLPLVPGLAGALARGAEVLDVGCGRGRALARLAALFPRSRFTGWDTDADAVASARADAAQAALPNLRFEVHDAAELDRRDAFHLVTAFGALHDQARPAAVVRRVARSLRPGGAFLVQEAAGTSHLERDTEHPLAPLLYAISTLHCTAVARAAGGSGLGTMWGRDAAVALLRDSGFPSVAVHTLPDDPIHLWFVGIKPDADGVGSRSATA